MYATNGYIMHADMHYATLCSKQVFFSYFLFKMFICWTNQLLADVSTKITKSVTVTQYIYCLLY